MKLMIVDCLVIALACLVLSSNSLDLDRADQCENPLGKLGYQVFCFADPCEGQTCPGHSGSTCQSNYCGGCYYGFYDNENNLIPECHNVPDIPEVQVGANCEDPFGVEGEIVQCFANPCDFAECDIDSVECRPSYCSGCKAVWYEAGTDTVSSSCNPTTCVDDDGNRGVVQDSCDEDLCDNAQCPMYNVEQVECRVNNCGTCKAEFYFKDTDVKVNDCVGRGSNDRCLNPLTGLSDFKANCPIDACESAFCQSNPDATCIPNNCGSCKPIFVDSNGRIVDCQTFGCPRDTGLCPAASLDSEVSRIWDADGDCAFEQCSYRECQGPSRECRSLKWNNEPYVREKIPELGCRYEKCGGVCPDNDIRPTVSRAASSDFIRYRVPALNCRFLPNPPTCSRSDGTISVEAMCRRNPCDYKTCPNYHDSEVQCTNSFCGGCFAIFRNLNGDIITNCGNDDDGTANRCPDDVRACPDGTLLYRDEQNNCHFPSCGVTAFQGCVGGSRECWDGSIVERDPNNNCKFPDCPACATDTLLCDDGTEAQRVFSNNCQFPSDCSGGRGDVICASDVTLCPDGSFVARDPDNNCQFHSCGDQRDDDDPGSVVCASDVNQCPDGSFVARDPTNGCQFFPCNGGGFLR